MNTSPTATPAESEPKRRRSTTGPNPHAAADTQPPPVQDDQRADGDSDAAPDDTRRRDPRLGPAVALVTAAIVFAAGQALLPSANPASVADAPVSTLAAAASAGTHLAPSAAPAPATAPAAAPVAKTSSPKADTTRVPAAIAVTRAAQPAKAALAEKDVAREAWRKNMPDITDDATRSSLLIPIRGAVEGASYEVVEKGRAVIINLPQAQSMITMPFYRLKHDAFRTLWIKQVEAEPTNLRLTLGAGFIRPEVEIKDGYVRVTVTRTAP